MDIFETPDQQQIVLDPTVRVGEGEQFKTRDKSEGFSIVFNFIIFYFLPIRLRLNPNTTYFCFKKRANAATLMKTEE